MTDYPSVDRLAQLQQMIADFAKVERVVDYANNNRLENDVEHSFGLAITCWYLQPKIAQELDLTKILKYALAHDIVELHAGDTYIFDVKGKETKETRERAASEQIRQEWPDFSDLVDSTEKYMDKADDEAKFVYAIDKMLPAILRELGNPSITWKELGITLDMLRENKVSMKASPIVSPYYEKLIEWLDVRDNIPKR